MKNYDAIAWVDGSYYIHGGCAAVLVDPKRFGKQIIVTDVEAAPTSNQRMELRAAIIALDRLWWRPIMKDRERLRRSKRVLIYSDSAYLVNCFIEGWIHNWRRWNWRRADGKSVKNRELWETLDALMLQYKKVDYIHVKGHNGTVLNELADKHAGLARVSIATRVANLENRRATTN